MVKINKNDRILCVHHCDLDGVVCSIILGNVFKNITYIDSTYEDIDFYLKKINFDKYDFVFLTDICPNDVTLLDLSEKIILLDHHQSSYFLNDNKKMRIVVEGVCASVLVKKFVENYFKMNLSYLNNLVRLTNDYDLWNLKIDKSRMLNELFWKYFSNKFRERFFNGDTRFNEIEIQYLRSRRKYFLQIYENLEIFDFEKINGCLIYSDVFISDLCDKLLKTGYKIVFCINRKNNNLSIRHNQESLDIGLILKELNYGGGHKFAGGMVEKDNNKLIEKIEYLQKKLYFDYVDFRK